MKKTLMKTGYIFDSIIIILLICILMPFIVYNSIFNFPILIMWFCSFLHLLYIAFLLLHIALAVPFLAILLASDEIANIIYESISEYTIILGWLFSRSIQVFIIWFVYILLPRLITLPFREGEETIGEVYEIITSCPYIIDYLIGL